MPVFICSCRCIPVMSCHWKVVLLSALIKMPMDTLLTQQVAGVKGEAERGRGGAAGAVPARRSGAGSRRTSVQR